MNKPICVLIKEVPEGNVILMKDTYIKLPAKDAFKLIENGFGIGYDPETKQEVNPFLSDEYPFRNILFNNDIYTEDQLKSRLNYVASLKGIGSKTVDTYKALLDGDTIDQSE